MKKAYSRSVVFSLFALFFVITAVLLAQTGNSTWVTLAGGIGTEPSATPLRFRSPPTGPDSKPAIVAAVPLFSQDFSSSNTVSDYVSTTPNNGQFNAIGSSGGGTVVSINGGGLQFARAASNAGAFARTTDFSPTPSTLIYKADITVTGNSAQNSAVFLYVGSGFSTSNGTEVNANVYGRWGINFSATSGNFSFRDIGPGVNTAEFSGTQTITWLLNNSGATVSYSAPDGSIDTVDSDKQDLWIGNTRVFNDAAVQTPTQQMTDIKLAITQGTGTIRIDNMQIDSIPLLAPEMNVEGNGTSIADGDVTPSAADHTDFGSAGVTVGTVARTFTIENLGSAALDLDGTPKVAISGAAASDFSVTSPPTSPVVPVGSTTFQVSFTPSARGSRTATISIANNDSDENPYNFDIRGTGVAPEISANGSLTFSDQAVNTPSSASTLMISNSGDTGQNLVVNSVSVTGANSGDFAVTDIFPQSIAPGSSFNAHVIFTPSALGARSSTLSINSNDPITSSKTVSLSGNGVGQPDISIEEPFGNTLTAGVSTDDYGDVTNGNSLTKTFTVRNTGTTTLNLGTITTSGGNVGDFAVDTLGMSPSVAPGGNTAFRVRITPSASGTRSTTLTISSDDSDENPFDLTLVGNGVTPVCTPPPANMAAWYTAENSAIDVIGGNSGTLSGGVTFVPGKVNQAFSFDGVDDLVTVPDNPSLQMTNAVSVDFWAQRRRDGIDIVAEKGGDWTHGTTNYGVGFHNSSFGSPLYFYWAGGGQGVPAPIDGQWHHYAVTAINGQSAAKFYIDGVEQSNITFTFGSQTIDLVTGNQPLHIGGQTDLSIFGNNLVDELEIFSTELSASDIQNIYNAGSAGKCHSPGTIGFDSAQYKGAEGTNVTITVDRTGDTSTTSSVVYSLSDGTATGGTCATSKDYIFDSNILTFAPGEISRTFQVQLCGDMFSENPAETINLTLSSPTNGTLGQSTATLKILDAATQFVNTTPIVLSDGLPGSIYPSSISVNGPAVISGLRLSLLDVTKVTSNDLTVMLVDPSGTRHLIFMANTGGANPLDHATITFEDVAPSFLPFDTPIVEGQNYKPTDCLGDSLFPPPAPEGPHNQAGCSSPAATFASAFGGINPNGAWSLYVIDEQDADQLVAAADSIGGWGIQFLTPTAARASLSGRVRLSNGSGISGAIVSVSGGDLQQPVAARTNTFGYYNFSGLTAGQAYIVTASARRYTFSPRFAQLFDDIAGFDFVADR